MMLALAFLPAPAVALDPSRAVTQYRRDAWNRAMGSRRAHDASVSPVVTLSAGSLRWFPKRAAPRMRGWPRRTGPLRGQTSGAQPRAPGHPLTPRPLRPAGRW